MRGGSAMVLALLGACSFDPGGPLPADPDAPIGGTVDAMGQAPPDATVPGPPDARQVVCPPAYNLPSGSSRYRLSSSKATWLDGELDCADDTANQWTHLAAIDSVGEWIDIVFATAITTDGEWWSIGVVRDADSPAGPWRKVTGGTQAYLPWRSASGVNEPTNTTPGEPVVVLDPDLDFSNDPDAGGFIDVSVDAPFFFVCECDGLPPVNATY